MKLWQEALVLLLSLALLGCRTDPRIALIERDNRELEDTIYELQACIEKYQRNLDGCRRQNAALQAKLNEGKSGGESKSSSENASSTETPSGTSPKAAPKGTPAPPVTPEELQPPSIELPPESSSTKEMPAKKSGSTAPRRPSREGPALSMPEAPKAPAFVPTASGGQSAQRRAVRNTQVAKIQLDERFTGGRQQEGVSVAIQPRDSLGRPCLAAAPVSVVVLDPALPGQEARVARWDFSAEEIAAMLRQSPPGEGIRLAMPWPQQAPAHKQLHLFVRYTTDKGQKLQADCPLELESSPQQVRDQEPKLLQPPDPQTAEAAPVVMKQEVPEAKHDSAAVASRPTWSPERR